MIEAIHGADPRQYCVKTKQFTGANGVLTGIDTVRVEWKLVNGVPQWPPVDVPAPPAWRVACHSSSSVASIDALDGAASVLGCFGPSVLRRPSSASTQTSSGKPISISYYTLALISFSQPMQVPRS